MIDMLIVIFSLACCLRLLFYRRSGSTFKRSVSIIAWLAIVGTGSLGLMVLTGSLNNEDLPPLLLPALIIFTSLVYYTRGNMALIIRITRGTAWDH